MKKKNVVRIAVLMICIGLFSGAWYVFDEIFPKAKPIRMPEAEDIVSVAVAVNTDDEFEIMKSHAVEGARIVKHVYHAIESPEYIECAANVAHYHHEKWNGKGYPDGLSKTEIPLEARIMAIADVFDALVSKR